MRTVSSTSVRAKTICRWGLRVMLRYGLPLMVRTTSRAWRCTKTTCRQASIFNSTRTRAIRETNSTLLRRSKMIRITRSEQSFARWLMSEVESNRP